MWSENLTDFIIIIIITHYLLGARGGVVVKALRYKPAGRGSIIGIFQWHNPSGRTMAPGVDSASNRYEYQVYFLGVKAAGA